jgi:hypothetical protein
MQPKYYGAAANYNKPVGGKSGLGGILKIFGIFVGAVIVLAVGFSIVNSLSKGPQENFERLIARESDLLKLMDKQKDNIRNSDLRTINATGTLLTAGDVGALNKRLTASFGAEGVSESIAAAETDTTSEATLGNAVITGTFDKTYVGILRDKIASASGLARTLVSSVSGDATKQAVQKTLDNLEAIDTQLSKLPI